MIRGALFYLTDEFSDFDFRIWNLIFGSWFLVLGSWFLVLGICPHDLALADSRDPNRRAGALVAAFAIFWP